MNSTLKTVIVWAVIIISLVVLYQVIHIASSGKQVEEIKFSDFMNKVDQGDIKSVTIAGTEVKGDYLHPDKNIQPDRKKTSWYWRPSSNKIGFERVCIDCFEMIALFFLLGYNLHTSARKLGL